MKKLAFAFALLTLVPVALAAGKMMREGQWEITSTVEMNGRAMPPQTFQKCVKPEDVKDPQGMIKNSHKSSDCDQKDIKVTGSTVSFSMVCHKGGNTQTGHGEITYSGESYSGTMT